VARGQAGGDLGGQGYNRGVRWGHPQVFHIFLIGILHPNHEHPLGPRHQLTR